MPVIGQLQSLVTGRFGVLRFRADLVCVEGSGRVFAAGIRRREQLDLASVRPLRLLTLRVLSKDVCSRT